MKKSKLKFYAQIIDKIKKEIAKRNTILHESGIDLINYENGYIYAMRDIILYELPFLTNDDLGWYLYEDVEKKYYFTDGRESIDLTETLDFLVYHMNCK